MVNRYEVYKCALCGNVMEVLTGADGALVCCGEERKENTLMRLEKSMSLSLPGRKKALSSRSVP